MGDMAKSCMFTAIQSLSNDDQHLCAVRQYTFVVQLEKYEDVVGSVSEMMTSLVQTIGLATLSVVNWANMTTCKNVLSA